jgi:hypothetical protein
MDQHVQLLVLQAQVLGEALLLEVEAKGLGEAEGHSLQPLVEGLWPGNGVTLHLDGSQQDLLVAQGQPPPLGCWLSQGAADFHGGESPSIVRPMADWYQSGDLFFTWLGHVDHHRSHLVAVNKLGELEVQEVQKARGYLHLTRSVGELKISFSDFRGNSKKSLKVFGIDQYFAVRERAAGRTRDGPLALLVP